MSFSRISLLALALGAGMAVPATAGTVSGDIDLFVTSVSGEVTGAFRDQNTSVSGSGNAMVSEIYTLPLDGFPFDVPGDPLLLSQDEFGVTTLPGVNGNAGFNIFHAFELQNFDGDVISFSAEAFLNLLSFGVSDFGSFDVILNVFQDIDGIETLLEPLVPDTNFASFPIANGVSTSSMVEFGLGSFALEAGGAARARVSILGFTQTFASTNPEDPPPVIPLPATAALLPLGLGALAALRRRKAKG